MKKHISHYERLHLLRQEKNLSQRQLAAALGISPSSYSRYELGKRSIPLRVLVKLSIFHHTSIDYLLNRVETPAPYPPAASYNEKSPD